MYSLLHQQRDSTASPTALQRESRETHSTRLPLYTCTLHATARQTVLVVCGLVVQVLHIPHIQLRPIGRPCTPTPQLALVVYRDTDPTTTLLPHSLYLYSTCDREVDRAVGLLGTSAHYTCYHYMLSLCQCCCCCCSCCYCCCCCYCYLLHSLYLQSVLLYRTPTSYSSLYLAQVMCYSYSLSPTTRSPTHLSTVSLLLVLVILLLPKIPQQVTTPSHYYC